MIWLPTVSLQVAQDSAHFCYAVVPDLKLRCFFCTYFIMVTIQYFLTVTPSNIIVNVVSSDYRAYCKGLKDSTLDAIVCARQSDLFEVYHSIGIV